jgi:predicted dehydrogenase
MGQTDNYANPVTPSGSPDIHETLEIATPFSPAKKLGIALVGLGTYSHDQLAPALLETKFCKLSGLITGSSSKTSEWKAKYNISDSNIYTYDNFDQIADNADIDIIYIVLPIALHAEYTIRAAKAGKHVICEKPMALTTDECDSMINACKKAEKLLSIGYRLHYDPYHNVIMKIGREKIFGEINYIHAQHGIINKDGWRLDKKMAGGGALMDLGIYCVHECRYITGQEPVAVRALEYKQADLGGNAVEQSLSWEMEFPNGLIAKSETSYANEMNLFHAKAEHGWFELAPAYSYNGIAGKTATGFLNFPSINQQALQMDDFALSVIGNKEVRVPGESGRKDIQIIQAIYESMKTGQRVEIISQQ